MKIGKHKINVGYALLIPALLYYIIFWFFPTFDLVSSTFLGDEGSFTLQNYINVFTSEEFSEAFLNTSIFVVLSLIIQTVFAIVISIYIGLGNKGSSKLLFIALIPMAVPPTAVAILWKTGLTSLGWVNSVLYDLNFLKDIDNLPNYLALGGTDQFIEIFLIVLVDTWTVLPSMIIILVAGLQGMNKEYMEAASVFGASKWKVIKDIVLPLMKPAIVTAVILRLISAMQVWNISVILYGKNKTRFLVERIQYYHEVVPGLPESDMLVAVYSVIVTVIVFCAAFVYLKISKNNKGGIN